MAIDSGKIKAIESLKDLSEDQISAIVNLSTKDEGEVIAGRVGKLATDIESDVLSATGIEKKEGEKYFNYLKRAFGEQKKSIADLTSSNEGYVKSIGELEGKIKVGIDEAAKSQIDSANQKAADALLQVKKLQDAKVKEKAQFESALSEKDKAYRETIIRSRFDAEAAPLKEKMIKELDPELFDLAYENAYQTVLSKYENSGFEKKEGKDVFTFRDGDKNPVFDPENNMSQLSIQNALLQNGLSKVIDPGRIQKGGGSNPKKDDIPMAIGKAKSQSEANEMIEKALAQKGVARGSEEFGKQYRAIADHSKISELPLEAR